MVQTERILHTNTHTYTEGKIVYVMNREMRVSDNWALLYAQQISKQYDSEFLVVYPLVTNFLGGTRRQLDFKIQTLTEMAKKFYDLGISFTVLVDEKGKEVADQIVDFCHIHNVGYLVTDFSPLTIQRYWVQELSKKLTCPVDVVDAHNIVPVWIASPKQEFAARTIRPKLYKLLPQFLDEFPRVKKVDNPTCVHYDTSLFSKLVTAREDVLPVSWINPGEDAAEKSLKDFLKNRFDLYDEKRNDPNSNQQSNLSPYLHYGNISAQRIALAVLKHTNKKITDILDKEKNGSGDKATSESAFLEELIIRRELSDNFCFYNKQYATLEGFPNWAQETLNAHRNNPREYVYTQKQFEEARTHDALWNACQKEMVRTGKMHGYMRMYWAKKILEWTKNPEDAMKIAIYLNDTYELDGRDPNGYVGIAWSIGGLHDRAWFPRPVFGTIRYMNKNGCDKKFDTQKYIEKYT